MEEAKGKTRVAFAGLLICFSLLSLAEVGKGEPVLHEKTFYSPPFTLGPGDVTDRYQLIEFPPGHIGVRTFDAEVVDERGNSVKLDDVYLHHWVVFNTHVKKGFGELLSSVPKSNDMKKSHIERMAFREGADPLRKQEEESWGACESDPFFALGSETRKTNITIPAPYGREFGNPHTASDGYVEVNYLNVHAIDTRETKNPQSCLECLCDAYGVTKNQFGAPLADGYLGGMFCCYEATHCALREDSEAVAKTYFFKYRMTWVDWDSTVVPVRSYVFDITAQRSSLSERPDCQIEYYVPPCDKESSSNGCVDRRTTVVAFPVGGDFIFGYLHQHLAGLGGMIYYKDGPVICSSEPIYGTGTEPGDEAGYVVGITSCHPEPGSVKVETMKELVFESSYSNEIAHTGVMSRFQVLVADPIPYIKEVTDV